MSLLLNETELRVLACLLEKSMATPEYYPLSLNSLLNACNQKSNRDPVVCYDEETVSYALAVLKQKHLAWQSDAGRVSKYAENFAKNSNLIRSEAALLTVLMLRGPQTPGELRSRAERMCPFDSLDAVQNTLNSLTEQELVNKLPRQPGCKESRYGHLLGDFSLVTTATTPPPACEPLPTAANRLTAMEEEITALRQELTIMQEEFKAFRDQF